MTRGFCPLNKKGGVIYGAAPDSRRAAIPEHPRCNTLLVLFRGMRGGGVAARTRGVKTKEYNRCMVHHGGCEVLIHAMA